MITRSLDYPYAVAGWLNPPPLTTYSPAAITHAWHPLVRPTFASPPPGPIHIYVPVAAPFGDDPTDPAMQTRPRQQTTGMFGRLHQEHGGKA